MKNSIIRKASYIEKFRTIVKKIKHYFTRWLKVLKNKNKNNCTNKNKEADKLTNKNTIMY